MIPLIGINGAIISSMISQTVSAVIVFVVLKRSAGMRFKMSKFLVKPIIATMLMMICVWNIYGYLIEELSSVTISFLVSMIARWNCIWIFNNIVKSFIKR
ncbi:MAG: polysaccharide biosynthesis C-terminal domain-containing protein [Oscillospiraceae bacterium]|nr:polysaccharide biosynthesis C-terminal domain-containing protein [Oscillospiraceae bacterium]